ncbi:protein arginine N-methyltransferase 7 [Lucilia sericata]|uniref:protein arginine N-methyltransferase 7 n=1 Tax=Lucilia sericata TaxID=13632 RepID=UPI0018A8595B|nr:protein arginine N-methyltransferase 7 [Lucilia sericata]
MLLKYVKTFKLNIFNIKRQMAVFTQVLNPITGQNEWASQEDSYDYHQEVANAGFGDMLHDKERNQKYYAALRKTIEKLHRQGKEAHVLDIGTGTGILSMMAVASGADSVTACEAFIPMANCAEQILEANKVKDKITLIKKRSTDIIVGEDMPRKANVLVTEVLDTELIGEGAIGIYNHAHDHLLTDDVICIPSKATCYAQVVQSPLAAQWNSLKILANLDGDILLNPPKDIANCQGEANLHDVQLSQLPLEQFRPIAEPFEIFEFDFNRKQFRELEREHNHILKATSVGSTDLVFYWWDISMDLEEEIKLSCAPFWAHPEFKQLATDNYPAKPLANVIPWRDHWMQAIYYIPKPLNIANVGEEFILNCNHDEYSLWFDVFKKSDENLKKSVPRHSCTCSLHMTYGRSRIGQMNQSPRNKRYLNYLEEHIKPDSQVLLLGDGCILGLASERLKASKVWCHEPHRYSRYFMDSVAKFNNLTNVEFLEKLDDLSEANLQNITHIFAEPYFLTSILPWDNFYFGTLLMKIIEKLSEKAEVSPFGARIYCVPVEFLDLHKIRTPLKECEGFNLKLFDKMVESSTSIAQSKVEAQPLWEYPCRALAPPQQLLQVEFRNFNQDQSTYGDISIEYSASCNGIALWVDWLLDNTSRTKSIVSSGPMEPIETGKFIKWDMFGRQGVHLIGKAQNVENGKSIVQWKVDFKPKLGQLDFNFEVKV